MFNLASEETASEVACIVPSVNRCYTLLTLGYSAFSDISAEGHHGLFYPLFSDSLQSLFLSDELFSEFVGHSPGSVQDHVRY